MAKTVLGVIGGSGVYDIAGLEHARWDRVVSPWGEPSDALLFGRLAGVDMIFLPRHGRGHIHSPTTINYRANIDALKRAGRHRPDFGVRLRFVPRESAPGTFAMVDQFIDRTHAREKSFFGKPASSPMSRWRIRLPQARRCARPKLAGRKTFRTPKAAPISRWKARNSRRWPNPISIAAGVAT
jgi:purine nucleoside phosphorylase